MNTKTTIIGIIAVIALLVGTWAKLTPATVITQNMPSGDSTTYGAVSGTNGPAANTVLANGTLLPNPTVYDYLIARAFLYTDKAIGYGNPSGTPVLEQGVRVAMIAATTTPCSLQSPFTTASSTFENVSVQVTGATSTAGTFAVGTSTNAFSTSTGIGTYTVAANAQATLTFAGSSENNIVGPSQWITFGVSGVPYGFTYTGACKAVFVTTN